VRPPEADTRALNDVEEFDGAGDQRSRQCILSRS
jgi:hypothetical protein